MSCPAHNPSMGCTQGGMRAQQHELRSFHNHFSSAYDPHPRRSVIRTDLLLRHGLKPFPGTRRNRRRDSIGSRVVYLRGFRIGSGTRHLAGLRPSMLHGRDSYTFDLDDVKVVRCTPSVPYYYIYPIFEKGPRHFPFRFHTPT